MRLISRSPHWSLLAFGDGRVAVHPLTDGMAEGEFRRLDYAGG